MTERMSDEELGKAIMAETACIPSIGDLRRAGAAARRLVHEDDLRGAGIDLSAISRSIIGAVIDKAKRRDKAILWDLRCAATFAIKQLESHLARLTAERDAALAEIEIWKSVFPDIAPDRVLPDRAQAEAEAFRAGAEAMREALRLAAIERAEWFEARHTAHASERGSALRYFLGEIKHTPLPAHQSTGDET